MPGVRRQEGGDLALALLGLQRADAVDQPPAGLRARARRRRAACDCTAARPAMSLGLAAQSTSGWRRKVPVAEQGASSSTASKVRRSAQVAASAATISAARPVRARFSATRFSRGGRAVERGDLGARPRPAAGSCRRARRTGRARSRPAWTSSSRAGIAAAASCTHQRALGEARPGRRRRRAARCAGCRPAGPRPPARRPARRRAPGPSATGRWPAPAAITAAIARAASAPKAARQRA